MEFMKKARNFVNDRGLVRCPCKKCVNMLHQPIEVMDAHIIDHRFDPFYKMWVFHGEEDEQTKRMNQLIKSCLKKVELIMMKF